MNATWNTLHARNFDIAKDVRNALDHQIRNEHAGYGQSQLPRTIHGLIASPI